MSRTAAPAASVEEVVPPQEGSVLSLSTLRLAAGAETGLGDPDRDTLAFVFEGSGSLRHAGGEDPLRRGSAVLVPRAERASLAGGESGLQAVRALVGTETDLHAAMGEREAVVQLEDVAEGVATGSRSFQIVFGPHNGSLLATLFVGHIPPGAAKLHDHLYDEIVWIVDGAGRLHTGGEVTELARGSAFRLAPRQLHIVENLAEQGSLTVLGLFTPAGSPSAAYLPV